MVSSRSKRTGHSGYALPTILVASAVMLVVLTSALSLAAATVNSLNVRHYLVLADAAARSGVTMAKECLVTHDYQVTWSAANPLRPNTNCYGAVISGLQSYFSAVGNYRTSFSVSPPTSNNGVFALVSQGTTELLRSTSGSTWRTYTTTSALDILLPKIVSIDGSYSHGIALAADRSTIFTWGYDAEGQLGNGVDGDAIVPTPVVTRAQLDGSYIKQVTGGGYHSMALTENGRIYAWGYNGHCEIGVGDTANKSLPVEVTTAGTPMEGRTIVSIGAGRFHSLAVDDTGRVYAWGLNDEGQLGDGSTITRCRPVAVSVAGTPLQGKRVVTAESASNARQTIVMTDEGLAYGWGHNANGQLGDGTKINRTVPVAVSTAGTPLQGRVVIQAIAGTAVSYLLSQEGHVFVLGDNNNHGEYANGTFGTGTQAVTQVNMAGTPLEGKRVTSLSADGFHILALTDEGDVYSWAWNIRGQLGIGTWAGPNICTSWEAEPCSVSIRSVVTDGTPMNGRDIIQVATGDSWSYAVAADGTTYSWGNNLSGILGQGTISPSEPLPKQMKFKPQLFAY
jgi:alpha-tubulin suppressor-like RCC1 family protein